MLKFIVFTAALLGVCSDVAHATRNERNVRKSCPGKMRYTVDFNGMWTSARHPVRYPSDATFSPVVVASHAEDFTLWAPGQFATKGVQEVAETGNPNPLLRELKRARQRGYVGDIYRAESGIDSADSVELEIVVTSRYPQISLVTMLFPSPDWFTGIRDIDMCDRATGKWKTEVNLGSLRAYDAGTDSGEFFTSDDIETKPAEKIFLLECGAGVFCEKGQKFLPVASVQLTQKLDCAGKKEYSLQFDGMWTARRHPIDYPSTASFSPVVVASHSDKFVLWRTGELAGRGVQEVAETGNPSIVLRELQRAKRRGLVSDIANAEAPIDSAESVTLRFTADNAHSLVSVVTMLFPSPDWFTGIRDVELCDRQTGKWKDSISLNRLRAYDAGTDSGMQFLSDDVPTKPAEPIFLLECGDGVFCKENEDFLPVAAVEITEQTQEEDCNFKCPGVSFPKRNRRCFNNFDDCACPRGYFKFNGQCVRLRSGKGRRGCNYRCPRNSFPKPNRSCYNNFDDCFCRRGYKKVEERCVRK